MRYLAVNKPLPKTRHIDYCFCGHPKSDHWFSDPIFGNIREEPIVASACLHGTEGGPPSTKCGCRRYSYKYTDHVPL